MKRSALLAAAVAAAALAGATAAVAEGPPDRSLIDRGREVYLTAGGVGCASCHGAYGEGDVGIGPYNRGVNEARIRGALLYVDAMKFLREELTEAQIKQLAAYTEWLGELKLIKILAKNGRFIPDKVEVYPGDQIQLVIANASTQSHTFAGDNMGFSKITVGGRESQGVIWTSPPTERTFTVTCADCGTQGEALAIEVTKKAPKFVPVKVASKFEASAPPASPAKPREEAKPQPPATRPDPQLVEKGRQVFLNAGEVGCVACHGRYAEGDVGIGPYNRGFSEAAIRNALKSVRPMAFLQKELSEEQIKAVAAYYQSLAHEQLVKALVLRGLFVPDTIRIHPGTEIQLAVINSSKAPRKLASPDMGIKDFSIPGNGTSDVMWKAPSAEGTFSLVCVDCPIKGQKLTIEVTNSVPSYTPPVPLK